MEDRSSIIMTSVESTQGVLFYKIENITYFLHIFQIIRFSFKFKPTNMKKYTAHIVGIIILVAPAIFLLTTDVLEWISIGIICLVFAIALGLDMAIKYSNS